MAKVQVQVTGGQVQTIEAATIGEIKKKLGVPSYTAQVNGDPAADGHGLSDYEFVTLTESVKSGC